MSVRVAAVDCGTNSTRLLLAEVDPAGRLTTLTRRTVVTRLGRGVDAAGRLAAEAIDRSAAVLAEFAAQWRAAGIDRVGVVATSAVRDAANPAAFTDAVRAATGITPRVLSGAEEAAWAFAGALGGVDVAAPALVVDIGGGSTELILGDAHAAAPVAATSRQLGAVRLTERLLPADPPTASQRAAAAVAVDAELTAAAAEVPLAAAAALVAVAGTATTLAALHLGLADYDSAAVHGTRLRTAEVAALLDWLAHTPSAEVARRAVVAPGREDVLYAGALILTRVLAASGLEAVVVSETDLLDALARQVAADRPRGV